MDTIAGEYVMTTCKQPKTLDQHTPPTPLMKRGAGMSQIGSLVSEREETQTLRDGGANLTPSPHRRGLGRGYLYLLQKSMTTKSSGFTIIECLLAIILVGILMTAVAPVIVLSVATRVQARRVEQATQAARSYIDGVQTGTIKTPTNTVLLSEARATTPGATTKTYLGSDRATFAAVVAPPSALINCQDDGTQVTLIDGTQIPRYPYCSYTPRRPNLATLYCVDNDGGGCTSGSTKDYIVQAFRSVKAGTTTPSVADPTDDGRGGYVLGVRVYRADGFDGVATLQTTNLTPGNKKVATYTGGKGNQFAPLAELTTEIRPVAGEAGSAMKSLCDRLGGCVDSAAPPIP